jgi:esterase
MKLHYREMGSGKPLVILHGLFGFSDNWQTHAKKFAEYYHVILVDLRNHGRSDWSESFSYKEMADDVKELCDDLQLSDIILMGHSMGGKVAICFAQHYDVLLEKIIVVDMGIKQYPMHHEHILNGIHAVNLSNVSARREAERQMSPHIESDGVKQFLLKNLYWKDKGELAWRMNVVILEREMAHILEALTIDEVVIPTLFIRGALSNYILNEDLELLEEKFLDWELITIQGAGHWVHAETPTQFSDSVLGFCLR